MKKPILFTLIFLSLSTSLFSQYTFIKNLNGINVGGNYLYGIVSYDDNSFIIGSNPVMKFDSSGTVVWAKEFPVTDPTYYGQKFLRTSDGKMVMDYEGNIIFMDTSGVITQSFMFTTSIGTWMDLNYIDQYNNIFLLGSDQDSITGSISVLKTDSTGTVIWNKVYAIDTLSTFPVAITETDDGGYLLAIGYLPSGGPSSSLLTIKLDSNGDIVRAFTHSWANTSAKKIFRMDSNKYFIPGNGCFMSFDSTGALNWFKKRSTGYWRDGIVGKNGHLYYTGEAWSDSLTWLLSGCIYEIDTAGNILNCVRAGDQDTCSMMLIDTLHNGNFIFFGGWINIGPIFLNTDSALSNSCYHYHLSLTDSTLPITSSRIDVRQSIGSLTFQITSPVLSNAAITDSLICDQVLNISQEDYNERITIFPNPTRSKVTIANYDQEIIEVKIFDIFSDEIYSIQVSDKNFILDVEDFKPGIYFVQIKSKNSSHVLKILKQ